MATGTTAFYDTTVGAAFIPTIWSSYAVVARQSTLVYADLVDRRYENDLRYGATINVPSVGNLAARTKTLGADAAITFETITETNTAISINTWEYSAIAVESITNVQANRDLVKTYAEKMGYAVARSIDTALAGQVASFTTNTAVGVLAVENVPDDFLRAIQYLDDANAPQEDRFFVVSPAAAIGLLRHDRFIHKDYEAVHGNQSPMTARERAYMTSFYGVPLYKSVNVNGSNSAGHDNVLMHPHALTLVLQMKPTARHMYDINYFVDKVALENVYGKQIMRNDHGEYIKGA